MSWMNKLGPSNQIPGGAVGVVGPQGQIPIQLGGPTQVAPGPGDPNNLMTPEEIQAQRTAGWTSGTGPVPEIDTMDNEVLGKRLSEPSPGGGIGLMNTLGIINMGAGIGSQIFNALKPKPRQIRQVSPGRASNPFGK